MAEEVPQSPKRTHLKGNIRGVKDPHRCKENTSVKETPVLCLQPPCGAVWACQCLTQGSHPAASLPPPQIGSTGGRTTRRQQRHHLAEAGMTASAPFLFLEFGGSWGLLGTKSSRFLSQFRRMEGPGWLLSFLPMKACE